MRDCEYTILCDVTRTCLPQFVDDRTEEPRVSEQHPAERHEAEEVETGDVGLGPASDVKNALDVRVGWEADEQHLQTVDESWQMGQLHFV